MAHLTKRILYVTTASEAENHEFRRAVRGNKYLSHHCHHRFCEDPNEALTVLAEPTGHFFNYIVLYDSIPEGFIDSFMSLQTKPTLVVCSGKKFNQSMFKPAIFLTDLNDFESLLRLQQ